MGGNFDRERIFHRVGSVTLEKTGLVIRTEGLRARDAVDTFLRFTNKPMIAPKEVVSSGLVQACSDGQIGIGRGPNLSNIQSRYCHQPISIDPNEDGLWIIPPFELALAEIPAVGISVGPGGAEVLPRPPTGEAPKPFRGEEKQVKKTLIRQINIGGSVPKGKEWSYLK